MGLIDQANTCLIHFYKRIRYQNAMAENSLSSDLLSFLQSSDESADLTLVLVCSDGGEVKVHRSILSARSPTFYAMMESDMKEKRSGRIELKDFEKNIVESMVQFIYTAKIDEKFEDFVDLMKIGHKYMIKSLVEECSKKIARGISKENVLELGVMADTYSVEDLAKSCAEFVVANMEVLGDDWEKQLKESPMFLISILRCVKDEDVVIQNKGIVRCQDHTLRVSRFVGEVGILRQRSGHDAITIVLSKAATLTLTVMFRNSPMSTTMTDVKTGQIPTLCFELC